MHRSRLSLLAIGVFGVLVLSLLADAPKPKSDPPFEKELLQVAKNYKSWGRVDDEMRWAPYLCREPNPAMARFSSSGDAETHGEKLYSLFAKNRKDYIEIGKTKSASVGQVIVKESWIPQETADVKPGAFDRKGVIHTSGGKTDADHFYPFATKAGRAYKASKRAGLFVMMKLDPKTAGTDDGWVYGTIDAEGQKVTSAGKVESCMKCHVDAKFDRLFGK